MTARFIVADVFDGLAQLETGSVDLVVTSPPFLALRSYLPADHPDKGKEIGSESTPAEFLDVMLRFTAELRRVLAPHGSICIELGDTYAGSGGAGGDYNAEGLRAGQPKFRQQPPNTAHRLHEDGSLKTDSSTRVKEAKNVGHLTPLPAGPGWPLAKSKTLIPELYRIALAYGRNPLRSPLSARELLDWFERIVEDMRAGGYEIPGIELLAMMGDYLNQREEFGPYKEYERWRVRNVVTWARPNPPVGALGDKWRPATSDLVVACTSPKRYWDDLATRKAYTEPVKEMRVGAASASKGVSGGDSGNPDKLRINQSTTGGAPLLDYWVIPPGGYEGSHYAVFPPELVEPCVKAMCPPKVCRTCGEPSRRITETTNAVGRRPDVSEASKKRGMDTDAVGVRFDLNGAPDVAEKVTLGWTDCGHDDWRPGLILDPFAGSGTTLLVATGHGHDAIGIDLDSRNAELAMQRVGPFLMEIV